MIPTLTDHGAIKRANIGGLTIWFYRGEAVAFELPGFARPVIRKAENRFEDEVFDIIDGGHPESRTTANDFEARLANATWWTGQEVPA